ncbi:MAG: DUF4003 family protein [Lachnospiraceae bacterium]|nr:DUF4003 family protein [Lachnospiraceae bacterium]
MRDKIRERCELLIKNRKAIVKGFSMEKELMSVSAAMIFTGIGREADVEKLKECKKILAKHTGLFSKFRKNVDLVLESRMALSEDPEKYIGELVDTCNKLRKSKMKENDFTIIAAMLICDLGKTENIDEVMTRYTEIMKRMKKEHPFITDEADSSYVMLLALSERDIDPIISDMEECFGYFSKTRNAEVGIDAIQGMGEVLALSGGDIKAKCERVDKIYALFKEKKAGFSGGREFTSLGALADIDAGEETLVDQIMEAVGILKEDSAFGSSSVDKGRRLMYAAILVADCYRDASAADDNTFISLALGILKDQVTVAVISAMIQMLPSVLGAVIDSAAGSDSASVSADSDSGADSTSVSSNACQ